MLQCRAQYLNSTSAAHAYTYNLIVTLHPTRRVVDHHDVVNALFAAAAADLPRSSYIFRSCTNAVSTELEYEEVVTTSPDKKCCFEEEYRFQPTTGWSQQAITIEVVTAVF
jgi:hypothetical protein